MAAEQPKKKRKPTPRTGQPPRPYRNKDGTIVGGSYKGKTINTTVSLYEGDHELLDFITEFLGTNRSDAIRASIRSFAAICQTIKRR